jgi:outer membrane protein assembly factor BamB
MREEIILEEKMKISKKAKKILLISLGIFVGINIIGFLFMFWMEDYSPIPKSGKLAIPKPVKELSALENREHDWPAWKGAKADNTTTFTDIKTDWSQGLTKLWEVDYLCEGKDSVSWSCPAIKGNRLVVPGRDEKKEYVFCLDPDTGELLWYKTYKSDVNNKSYGIGSRATPTIDEDRVYTLSRGGTLIAWQLLNGEKLWEQELTKLGSVEPQWGYCTSPVVYGDSLVVMSGGEALVIAFDKLNGQVKWKSEAGDASYSTPVVIKADPQDYLIVLGGKFLYGINAVTGKTLWEEPFETINNINIVTPPVDLNKNIAVLSAWYGHGSKAVKISAEKSEMLWENKGVQAHQADPFILDNYVYSFSGMSTQNMGTFKCLELETGVEKWASKAIGNGQFIYVEPYFISLDLKGNLFLVDPDPNEFKLVTSFPDAISDAKKRSWTKPVLAQGKLYLRYAHRLICYDIQK